MDVGARERGRERAGLPKPPRETATSLDPGGAPFSHDNKVWEQMAAPIRT